ncbi:MAG: hypothetical protein ACOZCL_16050 [Bacillota bacterium]
MVKIHTCTSCNHKNCCSNKAFDLYEEFSRFINIVGEIEMVGKKCSCTETCCGHFIEIDGEIYHDITVESAKHLIKKHYPDIEM